MIPLAKYQPTTVVLEARADFEFQHAYGAEKKQGVIIAPGTCIINLCPHDYGDITVLSYQEISYYVRRVLDKCEDLEESGTHFLEID